mmetsp:Transcript_17482/g.47684  ORF Transcript_17482/g.47684 Transcript_17482/m.47684 type:complete len:232 (-) Transcript_17482:282-977(-)
MYGQTLRQRRPCRRQSVRLADDRFAYDHSTAKNFRVARVVCRVCTRFRDRGNPSGPAPQSSPPSGRSSQRQSERVWRLHSRGEWPRNTPTPRPPRLTDTSQIVTWASTVPKHRAIWVECNDAHGPRPFPSPRPLLPPFPWSNVRRPCFPRDPHQNKGTTLRSSIGSRLCLGAPRYLFGRRHHRRRRHCCSCSRILESCKLCRHPKRQIVSAVRPPTLVPSMPRQNWILSIS